MVMVSIMWNQRDPSALETVHIIKLRTLFTNFQLFAKLTFLVSIIEKKNLTMCDLLVSLLAIFIDTHTHTHTHTSYI